MKNAVHNIQYSKRNESMDILKAICALLIVCIHIQVPNPLNLFVLPVTRIAVPIFFMITGYYYDFYAEKRKKNRQIIHIIKLIVGANLFYFFYNGILEIIQKGSIKFYLCKTISIKKIILFLITNDDFISGHLWYLSAILYVLLICRLYGEFVLKKIFTLKIIVIFLVCDLIFGKYSLLLLNRSFPLWLTRNFLFVGIPYFGLGQYIRKGGYKANSNKVKRNLKLGIIFFSITAIFENLFLHNVGLVTARDHGISITPLAICVFILFISTDYRNKIASLIGRRYSQNVYIFHPAIISIYYLVIDKTVIKTEIAWVAPIIVYIITILILILSNKFMNFCFIDMKKR